MNLTRNRSYSYMLTLVASVLVLVMCQSVARAAMWGYEYTGNTFSLTSGADYTTSDRVTASFELDDTVFATPGTCISLIDCGVTNLSMFDGNQTLTPADASFAQTFNLTLDTAGALPSIWDIRLEVLELRSIQTRNSTDIGEDGSNNFGQISNSPGTWTVTAVPIPAALWLFGSGLLGLVGMARRKKA